MKNKFCLILLIVFFMSLVPVYSENNVPEPYTEDEFPSFLYDLRRAEIITLGSMPFITLGTSLGYSFGKYAYHGFDSAYFSNPFAKTTESAYSADEQVGIILTSLGISLGIGITDFIVQTVKRNSKAKKIKNNNNSPIKITPISEDPDAVKISLSNEENLENKTEIPVENELENTKTIKSSGRQLNVVSSEE